MVSSESLQAADSAANGRFDHAKIGVVTHGVPYAVTAESIAAYCEAIGAHARDPRAPAPSVYVCVPAWETAWNAMAVVDRRLTEESIDGLGLHETHTMHFGRPIVPGMTLTTNGWIQAIRGSKRGTTVHLVVETRDDDGAFVASQLSTSFFRDETTDASVGDVAPEADPVAAAVYRGEPLGETARTLFADQGARYATVSGDNAPLHLDDAAAQRLGLPGSIVQGMCLLAIAADSAAQVLGVADLRLAAIRTRFARPVRPGIALTTRVWEAPAGAGTPRRIAFEALDDAGKTVLKHGALTL